jgi:hypothetical protein
MSGWIRLLATSALVSVVYVLSGVAAQAAGERLFHEHCAFQVLKLTCDIPEDRPLDPWTYGACAAALAAAWAGTVLFQRERAVRPFVTLFAALGLCAIAYDLICRNSVISGAKLINDTFNVLRLLVLASFILTLALARRWRLRMGSVVAAAIGSYAMLLAAMFGFIAVRAHLIGAFELFVLYLTYAFGGFTLHLMTLTLMLAAARPLVSGAGGGEGDRRGRL